MPRTRGPQFAPNGRPVYRAQLVLDAADDILLDDIARARGLLSRAAVIRVLIREEAARLHLAPAAEEGERE